MEMFIHAFVRSMRPAKDSGKFYADFIFMGGSLSVFVDVDQVGKLKPFEGKEGDFLFLVRPETVMMFSRPTCVFLPYAFSGIYSPKQPR